MNTENTTSYSMEIEIEPQESIEEYLIKKFKAEKIIWTDQTSSAGNWSGLIVKKVSEDQFDLIEFSQEVRFGDGLTTVWVGESITKEPVSENSFNEVIEMYYEMYYDDGYIGYFYEDDNKKQKNNNEENKTLEFSFEN
jgi:DUF1680 family protein